MYVKGVPLTMQYESPKSEEDDKLEELDQLEMLDDSLSKPFSNLNKTCV